MKEHLVPPQRFTESFIYRVFFKYLQRFKSRWRNPDAQRRVSWSAETCGTRGPQTRQRVCLENVSCSSWRVEVVSKGIRTVLWLVRLSVVWHPTFKAPLTEVQQQMIHLCSHSFVFCGNSSNEVETVLFTACTEVLMVASVWTDMKYLHSSPKCKNPPYTWTYSCQLKHWHVHWMDPFIDLI